MIVTENGTLKVTDFGLARSRHHVRLTETGALVGSLYYTPVVRKNSVRPIPSRFMPWDTKA